MLEWSPGRDPTDDGVCGGSGAIRDQGARRHRRRHDRHENRGRVVRRPLGVVRAGPRYEEDAPVGCFLAGSGEPELAQEREQVMET